MSLWTNVPEASPRIGPTRFTSWNQLPVPERPWPLQGNDGPDINSLQVAREHMDSVARAERVNQEAQTWRGQPATGPTPIPSTLTIERVDEIAFAASGSGAPVSATGVARALGEADGSSLIRPMTVEGESLWPLNPSDPSDRALLDDADPSTILMRSEGGNVVSLPVDLTGVREWLADFQTRLSDVEWTDFARYYLPSHPAAKWVWPITLSAAWMAWKTTKKLIPVAVVGAGAWWWMTREPSS